MKKFVYFAALLLFGLTGNANAITYDFNSLPEGIYTESDFNNFFEGVYFDNNGGSFRVVGSDSDRFIKGLGGPPRLYLNPNDFRRWEPNITTIATFDILADYVSISLIANNPHTVWFFMRVYDIDHHILSQSETIYTPTASQEGFILKSYTLGYGSSLADIASVEFWSDDGNFTQGDGYWDNFSFTPIPEPATMLLLGIGLAGLAGASRKKFKK